MPSFPKCVIQLSRAKRITINECRQFSSQSQNDSGLRQDFYSKLGSRGVLAISGPNVVNFLQGLITNHMPKIERGGDGFYTAFLAPNVGITKSEFDEIA
jgi:folate-binding Fe-S cluster repair protein YgfZ